VKAIKLLCVVMAVLLLGGCSEDGNNGPECEQECCSYNDCPAGQGCFSTGVNECLPYCRYPTGTPSCTFPDSCNPITDWPTWIGACI